MKGYCTEVKQFSDACQDSNPDNPVLMTTEAIAFIREMVNDELDELEVSYVDKVHLYGDKDRETKARIKVSCVKAFIFFSKTCLIYKPAQDGSCGS